MRRYTESCRITNLSRYYSPALPQFHVLDDGYQSDNHHLCGNSDDEANESFPGFCKVYDTDMKNVSLHPAIMKNLSLQPVNCRLSFGSLDWQEMEMNGFNMVQATETLCGKSFDDALAQTFFRRSERFFGIRHTVSFACRIIHFMVDRNRNGRAVDIILCLIRIFGKEDGSDDLLLNIFHETHTERQVLETVYSILVASYIEEDMVMTAHKVACTISKLDIFPSTGVCNKLIRVLLKLKLADEAWNFLDEMQSKGIALNASIVSLLVHYYCAGGSIGTAWELIGIMKKHGIEADVVTYSIIVHALCSKSNIQLATCMFFKMLQAGISVDSVLVSPLVNGYSRTRNLQKAANILKVCNLPFVISLFCRLITKLCRDKDMFNASLMFHEMTETGLCPDCYVYTDMMSGYCKVGHMNNALKYLGKMLKNGIRLSVTTYTVLIGAYCKVKDMDTAGRLYEMMLADGLKPDIFVFNSLVEGYGKLGFFKKVSKLFSIMRSVNVPPDTVTYNILIHSKILGGSVKEAKTILDDLIRGQFPTNKVTFTSVINGFLREGNFKESESTWSQMENAQIQPNIITYSARINGYCKAHRMDKACALFSRMLDEGLKPDLILFNTLIHGFCSMGNTADACTMVRTMVQYGILPNIVTCRSLALGFKRTGVRDPLERAKLKLQDISRAYSEDSNSGG